VLVRRLRGVAGANDALVQGALCGTVLLALPALVVWRTPALSVLALVVLFTAVQTAALAALAASVRRAEVSAIAPWHYSRLVFALAMDALLFGRVPPPEALAGAGLIAAGGLVLLRRPAG
jgi:drug/metabolite transporter (DMT)-like permease